MPSGRVFILESPNPLDLLQNRSERLALEQVCKLVGHEAVTFLLRNKDEFVQTCQYIGSITGSKEDKTPLFLHVSVHGNSEGIAIGGDGITWEELAETVQNMYTNLRLYHGPVILILSSCGANKQQLTNELTRRLKEGYTYVPPEFILVFAQDSISWSEAVVTWTNFYYLILNADFGNKTTIQSLLGRLHKSGFGHLKYFRWDFDTTKYLSFTPEEGNGH